MKKFGFINRLLEVASNDPEDARRRRLLNILLLGLTTLTSILFFVLVTTFVLGVYDLHEVYRLLQISAVAFAGLLTTFFINRYWSGEVASSLFVLLLITGFAFADDPRLVVEGRTLFLFTIPILMASVVLRPWASFIAAAICGLIISGLAVYVLAGVPPVPTLLGLFAVALVSWLSANSLEQALKELRIINIELDQRVEDRTRELAEANRELAEAYSQLQELDRLKSRFVSMVSHELRTPLNAILGFVEMLQANVYGDITKEQVTPLNRIIANTQRLLSIVNDLLDQARMEAGQLSIHVAPFSPHDLVDDLHSTVGVLAESKGLSLTTHIVEDVPKTLLGDRQRLHQLTVNLVNNAVKFTNEGGVHVQINLPDPEHWALVVSDTGPGIPDEAMAYIFEAFRQVDSSATREHQGTGLGLAIVKQLVELMGGEINVTSKLDYGSTFTVVLPLTPPQEAKNG